ncbi:B3 domain-containing protein Os04g0386900-like isoform X2 [Papaver somniferum]|nr:B3 domain-containing protein Os04g0386900-like isoform X2 [Papaver somniferum]XP_026387027.1 B3 domain-containing protein Os04g0386900-like isoform X2 [Papaver somniferum]
MEKPRANVAKPIQLDTQMELEQSGSSQSQIVLGLPSLQETVDTQMESEHSSSSHIILAIKVSDINDSKSPCNPIQQEAENETDSTEEEQDKMKLNDTTTMEEHDEPYFLTDKPYFHCILGKTQLHNMGIPKSVNQLLPEKEVPVNLSYRNKTWKVKYQGNRASKKFDSSWKHFVHDNNLRFGDGCVFELTEHSDNCINFRIQILDGDVPSELLDRVDGQTIEHPITIG